MVLNDGGSAKRSRRFYLKIILFEDNKIEKFKYIKMGIRDYKNNIFGKFEK